MLLMMHLQFIVDENGSQYWEKYYETNTYVGFRPHREGNLPAVFHPNGDKEYFLNGNWYHTNIGELETDETDIVEYP